MIALGEAWTPKLGERQHRVVSGVVLLAAAFAVRPVGEGGFALDQVIGILCAVGTAVIVARMAAPMAGLAAATLAGAVYLLLSSLVGGAGDQAEGVLIAGAALATLIAVTNPDVDAGRVRRLGAMAMGLIGLAGQVEGMAIFNGLFVVLALMWASWRASRKSARLAADVAIWTAIAFAPAVVAGVLSAERGPAEAVLSALVYDDMTQRLSMAWTALHVPLLAAFLAALLAPWKRFAAGARTFWFAMAWLAVEIARYAMLGADLHHDALPLLAPLAVACAPLFTYRPSRFGAVAAALLLFLSGGWANAVMIHRMRLQRSHQAEIATTCLLTRCAVESPAEVRLGNRINPEKYRSRKQPDA